MLKGIVQGKLMQPCKPECTIEGGHCQDNDLVDAVFVSHFCGAMLRKCQSVKSVLCRGSSGRQRSAEVAHTLFSEHDYGAVIIIPG